MAIEGGSLTKVKQVSDPDGLEGKVAIPVHGFATAERGITAGEGAMPVYVVSEAQIQSGEFSLMGGSSLPVIDAAVLNPGEAVLSGGKAIPVYLVSGSLGGAGASPPDAPTDLTATAVSGTQIDLSWTASDGATGYKIERGTDGVAFVQIDTVGEVTGYENTGLTSGLYYYRVLATGPGGDSDYSNTANATITYAMQVLATEPVLFVPMDDTSGTVATDLSGNDYHGQYNDNNGAEAIENWPGASATDGPFASAPYFQDNSGTGGDRFLVDMLASATGFATAADWDEATYAIWCKVENVGWWTDGLIHYPYYQVTSGNTNRLLNFGHKSATSNQINFRLFLSGGSADLVTHAIAETGWYAVMLTVSRSANQMKAYVNGTQVGATVAVPSDWNDNTLTLATVGTSALSGASNWRGWLAGLTIWNKILTESERDSFFQ
jgi:hypothetical protein